MNNLTRKQRKMLYRILAAAALLIAVKLLPNLFPVPRWMEIPLYLAPYLIIGWDVLWKAVRNILNGQVFDENFLMALATVGAFATGEYAEAVFVMLFYQTGELFQDYAVGKSRQSIAALMDIRPDTANLELEDGSLEEVDPEDVEVGAVVVVRPGERVPLDGEVLEGASALDTAALTGESAPRDVGAGDAVISGCVNQSGLLRVKVTKPCEESTVSKILDLVENAGEKKPPARTSSPASPGTIPPAWSLRPRPCSFCPPSPWRCFRPLPSPPSWRGRTGPAGSTGPSSSWSSPAPAPW